MMTTPTLDQFARRGRWRSFTDPEIEAGFQTWHREHVLRVVRPVGLISAVLWAANPVVYNWAIGDVPAALKIGNWLIAVPVLVMALLASYTSLARWMTVATTIVIITLGLDFGWIMSQLYGWFDGTVVAAVLVFVFFAVIVRLSTLAAAVAVIVLTAAPVGLLTVGIMSGRTSLLHAWPYVLILLTLAPIVIVAASQIEGGMRREFAAQQVVARQKRQLEASQRLIRRYAPAAVAARIESGDAEAVGVPQRMRVTALSSDVAGFTTLADRLDPEALSEVINEYVGAMSSIVEGHGGVITEFAGDGLTAIFGAPERVEPVDQVRQAVAAATEMHRRLAELNASWGALGVDRPLQVRIGINTGVLSVGTFGSDGRATYTAIGLQMNIAARIQAQCEPGQTLLSSTSWHAVKDEVACDLLAEVQVKGVHFPISVYEPRAG
jgi:class 3 adenylate cyclase